MPEPTPHRLRHSAAQFVFGIVGLALITFGAVRFHLQPGAISLLYLIVIVFVSLRAGIVSSVLVSLIAVSCLHYYFIPLFSPPGSKNPLDIVATFTFLITALVITAMVARVRKLTEAQLTLRFEERLAERTRIARELHDTLLQSFQGLMLHFQAVNDLLSPGQAKERLEKALDRADQAIVEGRDAIQNLRSSTTVTNAFRHARASKIEAEITYSARLLRLRIRDDGKGIDSKLLDAGRDGHWGLPGMRERAQQIGAQFDMWSEVGAGTEVELRIPASVAYATSPNRGGFRLFRKQKEAG